MDQHGPLFVIAGVLILAGIQMLAIGLLGELQVRHFHTAHHRARPTPSTGFRAALARRAACCGRAKPTTIERVKESMKGRRSASFFSF